jgi:hypothetical protein
LGQGCANPFFVVDHQKPATHGTDL